MRAKGPFCYGHTFDSDREACKVCTPPPRVEHRWRSARFTGNVVCERCGLLPLDNEDTLSECTPTKED